MNEVLEIKPLAEKMGALMDDLLTWRPEIEDALQHAEFSHTFDDITAMVIRGELVLHTFEDCFSLTSITVFPQFKVLHFMIVGGKLQSIIRKKALFQTIAKEHGCQYLSFSGRPGWARALKEHGWFHKFTTMWSEVDE